MADCPSHRAAPQILSHRPYVRNCTMQRRSFSYSIDLSLLTLLRLPPSLLLLNPPPFSRRAPCGSRVCGLIIRMGYCVLHSGDAGSRNGCPWVHSSGCRAAEGTGGEPNPSALAFRSGTAPRDSARPIRARRRDGAGSIAVLRPQRALRGGLCAATLVVVVAVAVGIGINAGCVSKDSLQGASIIWHCEFVVFSSVQRVIRVLCQALRCASIIQHCVLQVQQLTIANSSCSH